MPLRRTIWVKHEFHSAHHPNFLLLSGDLLVEDLFDRLLTEVAVPVDLFYYLLCKFTVLSQLLDSLILLLLLQCFLI